MTRGRGQPQKPYLTTWGEAIAGLGRTNDGRWRIIKTGERFTEANEHRAIERFRNKCGSSEAEIKADYDHIQGKQQLHIFPEQIWEYVAEQIRTRPQWVAQRVGIEQIGYLSELKRPAAPLLLSTVVESYRTQNTSQSKKRTIQVFEKMMRSVAAETLADITTDRMLILKRITEADPNLKSGDTKAWMYGQVKTVIGFGLRVGLDKTAIRSALDACEVLWTATAKTESKPTPISRGDFHKLLEAGNGSWRPWLLLGLNCCLHLGEVLLLKWTDFDLVAGTYSAIRRKTKVARAAVLWPTTIEAMRGIKRTGSPYVFLSSHGNTFNRRTRTNAFGDLRTAAGLPDALTFEWIRDGAYTAAIQAAPENETRVFAGHVSPGDQDDYVLRNPSMTAKPSAAVYQHYFG